MHFRRVLFPLVLASLASICASAQSVISVRSGVVHFFEGSVFIDDQPLEPTFGTFPMINEGSRLWTGDGGRVEVLLTPGVFLRLDENSSIRMVTNSLSNTRVEFLRGSAILDSGDAAAGNSVVVTYKDWQIRFPEHGVYRIDSDPAAVLQAYSGEAEVTRGGKPLNVDASHLFFFAAGTATNKYDDGADDDFYQWAENRSQAIAKDNQLSADTSRDPADLDNGQALPAVPDLSLGMPSYSAPLGTVPLGGSLIYPYHVSVLRVRRPCGHLLGIPFVHTALLPRLSLPGPSNCDGLAEWNHPARWKSLADRNGLSSLAFHRYFPAARVHASCSEWSRSTCGRAPYGPHTLIPLPAPHVAMPAHPIGHR